MPIYEVDYKRTLAFGHQWQQHNLIIYPFSFISVVTNKNILYNVAKIYLRVKEWKTNVGDYRLPLSPYLKNKYFVYKCYWLILPLRNTFWTKSTFWCHRLLWKYWSNIDNICIFTNFGFPFVIELVVTILLYNLQLMCGLFVLWGGWRPPV